MCVSKGKSIHTLEFCDFSTNKCAKPIVIICCCLPDLLIWGKSCLIKSFTAGTLNGSLQGRRIYFDIGGTLTRYLLCQAPKKKVPNCPYGIKVNFGVIHLQHFPLLRGHIIVTIMVLPKLLSFNALCVKAMIKVSTV